MRCAALLLVVGAQVGCSEYDYVERRFTDDYRQIDTLVAADVLLVVDDSASMAEEQVLLAANFQAFTDVMAATEADFQLGVITTDASDGDAGLLRGGILTPDAPDLGAAVLAALDVGTHGARDERGLLAASMAVDGRNPGLVRPGAKLNVVVFSDEDDHSAGSVEQYLDAFDLAADGDDWAVHGVVGDLPDGCANGLSAADAGARYIAAIHQTEGYIDSICASDYTGILTKIGLDATGLRDAFPLTHLPEVETLQVLVDDVGIPSRDVDGWTYSPGDNTVVFHGRAIPRPGMRIGVSYELLLGATASP